VISIVTNISCVVSTRWCRHTVRFHNYFS